MQFNIDYKDYGCRDTDYGQDKWDYSWSEDHSYDYKHAVIVKDGYSDIALFPGEADAEIGGDIHMVYVSYDTGDSFGNEHGKHVHLWAFTDRKRAYRLADALNEDGQANPDYDFDNKPFVFEGVPISTNEWKGYFERFGGAEVETLVVRKR